jgi:hypothetical protein
MTMSAETEQRVVCGLSFLMQCLSKGVVLHALQGWSELRQAQVRRPSSKPRPAGPLMALLAAAQARPRSRPGCGGGPATAKLPTGKERPRRCKTSLLPDTSCHHVDAAAWNDLLQPERLHRSVTQLHQYDTIAQQMLDSRIGHAVAAGLRRHAVPKPLAAAQAAADAAARPAGGGDFSCCSRCAAAAAGTAARHSSSPGHAGGS